MGGRDTHDGHENSPILVFFSNLLVAVVVFGLWLRYPMIGNGMPYIYDVDEGHHYNRLVEMVKEGELNPRYFRKPSLHFYLRMPAVAGGFLWSATEGELESIEDIVTRDPFGRGGWARAASHPSIVMWTRSVTTVLSLLIIVVTYLLAAHLVQSRWMGVGAALARRQFPGAHLRLRKDRGGHTDGPDLSAHDLPGGSGGSRAQIELHRGHRPMRGPGSLQQIQRAAHRPPPARGVCAVNALDSVGRGCGADDADAGVLGGHTVCAGRNPTGPRWHRRRDSALRARARIRHG